MHGRTSTATISHKFTAIALAAMLIWAPAAQAERTKLKPGWNLYSPKQDVELGLGAAKEAEKELTLLNDARVDRYVAALGKRLSGKAPGEKYPYQFKVVNDKSINAFALPGGYIYVHRGVIESSDNEAQLAGVIGHEIGHIALRHGTNQASKAAVAQGLLALGGAAAGGGVGGALVTAGGGMFASGVLLKYGRDAERQSDIIGTQILYDLNYDPRAMAQFFEKLEAESKGKRPPEILSSHPNPGNRMRGVLTEIDKIGPFPRNPTADTSEFRQIKAYIRTLPEPPKKATGSTGGTGSASSGPPAAPSAKLRVFENRQFRVQHPDNWEANAQGNAVTFVPQQGAVRDAQGNVGLAYGVIVNVFEPRTNMSGQFTHEEANSQLIEELRKGNPKMSVARNAVAVRVGPARERGLSTQLVNDSPVGGREIDTLVTFVCPEGLLYFVFVAPEKDVKQYNPSFQAMLDSLRFAAAAR